MQTFEVVQANEFAVYKQVIRGAFNPVTVTKTAFKSSLSLVRSANTYVVCSSQSKEEALNLISSIDLTAYGYYTSGDIDISYDHDSIKKTCQVIIKPKRVYPLNEDILLPDPPDERAIYYRDFFSDELERVKLRAEKSLLFYKSREDIISYALCSYQILDKLFHESRICFNTLSTKPVSKVHPTDLYIMYILNLFIIRCLVFYSKFFKPWLSKESVSEEKLRSTFQKEIPRMLKYPWLFIQRPPLYEVLYDNDNPALAHELNPVYQKSASLERPEIPDALLKEALEIMQLKGCMQLTGPRNAFLAEIYKMRYEKDKSGKTMINAKRNKLIKLLAFAVLDDKGDTLNENTINTDLKPANVEKRPGK